MYYHWKASDIGSQEGVLYTYDPAPFMSRHMWTSWKNLVRHEQALAEGRFDGYPAASVQQMSRQDFIDHFDHRPFSITEPSMSHWPGFQEAHDADALVR